MLLDLEVSKNRAYGSGEGGGAGTAIAALSFSTCQLDSLSIVGLCVPSSVFLAQLFLL